MVIGYVDQLVDGQKNMSSKIGLVRSGIKRMDLPESW